MKFIASKGSIVIKAEGATREEAEANLLDAWDAQMNKNGASACFYDESMANVERVGVIRAMMIRGFQFL